MAVVSVKDIAGAMKFGPIKDHLGRSFKTLRLSLTPVCNFACTYCVPENSIQQGTKINNVPADHYQELVRRVHELSPLDTVRLTGGEPLLYHDIVLLIKLLKQNGIQKVKLTTNGYKLKLFAQLLKDAGLDALNVSLDAMNAEIFRKVARHRGLEQVLAGIEAAIEAGLDLKLNATIIQGLNEQEILPLLDYAKSQGITIRYLELMRMGHLTDDHQSHFYSQADILARIKKHYPVRSLPRKPGSTANYWQIVDSSQKFGVIANHSDSFCHDCHRLRMDANGNLYGCLSEAAGYRMPVVADGTDALRKTLIDSLAQKQFRFHGSEISMKAIGG